MASKVKKFFHIHLVSDATGETLNTVARAAAAQYADFQAVEHVHALVRTQKLLNRVITDIQEHPGVVLFTILDSDLRHDLEEACKRLQVPCISVLDPVVSTLATYLNAKSRPQIGGQHALNAEYFRRIDALNFTMLHDDGQHPDAINEADIVLIGISRTSKTPTSMYLANRGIKVANVPIVTGVVLPDGLEELKKPLVVGLVASTDRIAQIRRNRLLSLREDKETNYVDRTSIADELAFTRKLCNRHDWPIIDVTRRSIEETAAAILNLYNERNSAL
ncbi:MAG: pyruvate, water dikinase regulatory protein [Hyphomicrobiales bacterium]